MSRLRLHWPSNTHSVLPKLKVFDPEADSPEWRDSSSTDESAVLSFAELSLTVKNDRVTDFTERARLIHSNRICPYCCRATVEIRDLVSGLGQRHRLARAQPHLSFYCVRCHNAWSV